MSEIKDDLIRKELLKLITSASDSLKVAKVLSVDKDKQTCKVKLVSDDNEITARLRAVENGEDKGSWYVPKVGSTVVVGRMAQFKRHVVLMFSEIDEMHITCDKVVYNGGNLGGLVIVQELVDKINALEQLVNKILTTLKSTSVPTPSVATGTYSFAPLYLTVNAIAPLTKKADLENTKIKH